MVRDISKIHDKYYEANLQLRDVSEEVVKYAESEINRVKLYVAKTAKLKNGYDYFLSDSGLTRALGKSLQQKYGGDLKVTSSLFGQSDGKDIYRVTVMFREAHFRKNDLVMYKGEEYNVKIVSKDILLQNAKTGKKVHIKYKEMRDVKKVE
jgi:nonsense-mediated mRNA decay protein 3